MHDSVSNYKRTEAKMTSNKSIISAQEAADLVGCSLRKIQGMCKSGVISSQKDGKRSYKIDMSELVRVFPEAHNKRNDANQDDNKAQMLAQENEHLKEMLRVRTQQNDFLHEQLELICAEKSRLIDIFANSQKLLEHQAEKKRKKVLGIF